MKLADDYVQVPLAAARSELKGEALAYLTAQQSRDVWRNTVQLPGYLITTAADAQAGGRQFKQFLPEGVHLGWADQRADGQLDFFRKNFQPLVASVAPPPPRSLYGEQYLVYGAWGCGHCLQRHAAARLLTETETTRFKILQFAAEIATISDSLVGAQEKYTKARVAKVELPPAPKGLSPQDKKASELARKATMRTLQSETESRATRTVQQPTLDPNDPDHEAWLKARSGVEQPNPLTSSCRDPSPTMLGLLMCGAGPNAKTYVAASGSFANSDPRFARVAQLRGYTVCLTPKSPYQTFAGGTIPGPMYTGTKADGAQAAGTCAAPKLISQAIKDGCAGPLTDWHMSEIWYWRQGMPASDLVWVPGLSAYSCDTCQNLVPLFLCPTLTT